MDCQSEGCKSKATGAGYSTGLYVGSYCDTHGNALFERGEIDDAHPIDDAFDETQGEAW